MTARCAVCGRYWIISIKHPSRVPATYARAARIGID